MGRCLLASIWICLAAYAQAPDAEERLMAGQRALERGDFRGAVRDFQSAAAIVDEKFVPPATTHQILVRYAESLLIVGEYARAEEVAGKGSDLPAEFRVRLLIVSARVKAARGDFSAALEELQAARRLVGANARASTGVAAARVELLLAMGKPQEASAEVRQLSAQTSRGPEATRLLAEVAVSTGDYGQAETLLSGSEIATSEPLERLRAAGLRARLLAATQRSGAAAAEYGKACTEFAARLGATNGETARCWTDAGAAAYWAGRRAAAATWLQSALASLGKSASRHPLAALHEVAAGYEMANRGQSADARVRWEHARAAHAALYGEVSAPVASIDLLLAATDADGGRCTESQNQLSLVEAAISYVRPEHILRLRRAFVSAKCAVAQKSWPQAASLLAQWRKNRWREAEEDGELAAALSLEGEAAWHLRRWNDAESALAKSLEIRRAMRELDAAGAVRDYTRLAEARAALNRFGAAADAIAELLGRDLENEAAINSAMRVELVERLAEWRESAGQPGDAATALLRAIELRGTGGPDSLQKLEKAARLERAAGREDAAIATLRRDLEIRERTGQLNSEDALGVAEELARFESGRRKFDASLPLWRRLAEAGRGGTGIGARNRVLVLQQLAEAEEALQKSEDAARTWMQLARLVMLQGNLESAEDYAGRAGRIAPPSSPEAPSAFQLIAAIRTDKPGAPDAEGYLRKLLEMAGSNPGARALALSGLSRLNAKKNPELASSQCSEAERQIQSVDAPAVKATVLATRGFILSLAGSPEDAAGYYSRFLAAEQEMNYERDFPLFSLLAEASRFFSTRDLNAVEKIEHRRMEATRAAFGERSAEAAQAIQMLASTMAERKNFAEAERMYGEAHSIFKALGDKAGAAGILASVAELSARQRRLPEALTSYTAALAEDSRQERELLPRIGAAQMAMGDSNAAVVSYRRLVEIWNQGDVNSNWVDASRQLNVALIRLGKSKEGLEGVKSLRKAVRGASGNKDSIVELTILRSIGDAFRAAGRSKEAVDFDREAKAMAGRLRVGQ
jgi:hypothetical protein